MPEQSYRRCACGCGEFTPRATRTQRSRGVAKGDPLEFCPWHKLRGPLWTEPTETALAKRRRRKARLRARRHAAITFLDHTNARYADGPKVVAWLERMERYPWGSNPSDLRCLRRWRLGAVARYETLDRILNLTNTMASELPDDVWIVTGKEDSLA